VQPWQAIKVENQKVLDEMYNNMISELEPLSNEIDGDADDNKVIQEGMKIINKYQAKANMVESWEKQHQVDRQVAYNNMDQLTEESRRSILQWKGGQPYQGFVKFKPKDPRNVFTSLGETIQEGSPLEVANAIKKNTAGEVLQMKQRVQKGESPFWKKDPETGQWVPNDLQRQVIKSKAHEPLVSQGLIEELRTTGKEIDKENGIYKVGDKYYSVDLSGRKTTEEGRPVNNLVDYAYDMHRHEAFRKTQVQDITTVTPEPKELTQKEKEAINRVKPNTLTIGKGKGKRTYEHFVHLSGKNVHGEAGYFDKVIDPRTGENISIEETRDWHTIGVDPLKGEIVVGLKGATEKETPGGTKALDAFGTEMMQDFERYIPDIQDYKYYVVPVRGNEHLLGEQKFYTPEGEPLLQNIPGRSNPLEDRSGQQKKKKNIFGR
jgi:hypothetical protein